MRNKCLLTISVLVSGKEEGIRKCLDSLSHLRKAVDCELILTDTGCAPLFRTWLEGQADKVITFQWCDDFAEARNAGLREARGDWFLYLDDDEWFEDTTEIEKFFQSGAYRQYESASYKVRNYTDFEASSWRDSYLSRMVRRRKETKFAYPVHEALTPMPAPMKYLEDYVHHYGYAFRNKEQKEAKKERNLALLRKAIKNDRHCLRHYMHAMTEYAAAGDFENSLRMAYEGIRQEEPSRQDNGKYINALYAAVTRHLTNLGRFEEACREAKHMIGLEHISPLAVATICGDVTWACLETGAYKEGTRYLDSYLQLKAGFDGDKQAYLEQQTMILETCFEPEHYRWVMGNGLALAALAGKKEKVISLLAAEKFTWWKEALADFCGRVSAQDLKELCRAFEKLPETDSPYLLQILVLVSFNLVEKESKSVTSFDNFHEIIGHYAEKVISLYQRLYRPEVTENYLDIMPGEYLAALHLNSARQTERETAVLGELKLAAQENPGLAVPVRKYVSLYRGEAAGRDDRRMRAKKEMEILGGQIKEEAYRLLEQGQESAALDVIRQLLVYRPDDEELQALERKLASEGETNENSDTGGRAGNPNQ